MPQLFGILGQFAYLGPSLDQAEPYATGAELPGGFKLVEIGAGSVVIEREGERETLNVFPALDEPVSGGGRGPGRGRTPRRSAKAPERPAPPSAPSPEHGPPPGAAPAPPSMSGMPPEVRKKIEEARRHALEASSRAAGA